MTSPGKSCIDTDNGATDAEGDGCMTYTRSPSLCEEYLDYDDSDFISKEMCCTCGGGNKTGTDLDILTRY